MGIVHAHRGRLAPALILAVLMALAVIVTLGLAASPASAQSDVHDVRRLPQLHGQRDAFHDPAAGTRLRHVHTCHATVSAPPGLPSACATCHTSTALATDVLVQPPTHPTCARPAAPPPGCRP